LTHFLVRFHHYLVCIDEILLKLFLQKIEANSKIQQP
jgi:hypothetical protein